MAMVNCPEWVFLLPTEIRRQLLRGETIVVGSRMYRVCRDCMNVVWLNKPIVGSTHLCR